MRFTSTLSKASSRVLKEDSMKRKNKQKEFISTLKQQRELIFESCAIPENIVAIAPSRLSDDCFTIKQQLERHPEMFAIIMLGEK